MDNIFNDLWIEKFRPEKLADVVLSDSNRKFLEQFRGKNSIPHLLFSGSPGIGKTTVAQILVDEILDCQYLYINASEESGVDTIRNKVINFAQTLSIDGKLKVVLLDEIDGLSGGSGAGGTSAQKALRNVIEKYSKNTRFIATCNYLSMVSAPIKSRFQVIDLTPNFDDVFNRIKHIVKTENVKIPAENKEFFIKLVQTQFPDMRKIIGEVQKYTINGVFVGNNVDLNNKFVDEIVDMLKTKKNHQKIREFVLSNEIKFYNDYHGLLKMLFESIYSSKIEDNTKSVSLLIISQAMYSHQIVMDHEINFYACILELLKVM